MTSFQRIRPWNSDRAQVLLKTAPQSRYDQAGIRYMLTGSMAMNYYAQPRMTRDVDVVVSLDWRSACMTDTPAEIEQMVRERIIARSPEERSRMGAEMFDATVTMILASLPPDLPAETRRRRLFQRLYGMELPA